MNKEVRMLLLKIKRPNTSGVGKINNYSASKQVVIVSVLKSLIFSILNVFSVSCMCYHHKSFSFGMHRGKNNCNSSLGTWTGVTYTPFTSGTVIPFYSDPFHNRSIEQFWCAFTLRLMILIRTSGWGRFPYCVMTYAVLIAFALSTCPRGWHQEYQHVCCLCYACKHMKTEEQRREPEEGDWPSLPSLLPRLV